MDLSVHTRTVEEVLGIIMAQAGIPDQQQGRILVALRTLLKRARREERERCAKHLETVVADLKVKLNDQVSPDSGFYRAILDSAVTIRTMPDE